MSAIPFAASDDPPRGYAGPDAFSLRFSREAHEVVVEVAGELDGLTAPLLLDPLLDVIEAQGNHNIAIDVGGVPFMDSSGLRSLVTVHSLLEKRRGALVVRRPAPTVRRMLEITGMYDVLNVQF